MRPFRPYLLHGVSRERGLSAVDVVVHLDPEHRVEVEIEVGRLFAVEFPSYVDQQIDVEGLEADLRLLVSSVGPRPGPARDKSTD